MLLTGLSFSWMPYYAFFTADLTHVGLDQNLIHRTVPRPSSHAFFLDDGPPCSGGRQPFLEAEAGKEQVNLSFELGPVVAKQCRAKQSLQIGGDDLGHTLGVKFGWQFTGVF